jgi:molybdopterin/thiamine biosynthesis adenylyltransferase
MSPRLPENPCVKLIGLGGVGGILARYASVFLNSLGGEVRLVLVDGDTFEHSNATRMLFSDYGNKATVMRRELLGRFTDSALAVVAVEEYVTAESVARLIHSGDICLLAVDNHATRKLVNDHCTGLADICLISGGNDGAGPDSSGTVRRGTFGNVQAYVRRNGQGVSCPLTRNHPEIEKPADRLPTDLNCTELIASVPQVLFANLAVASAMLNTLWLYLCGELHYGELAFDIADGLMRPVVLLNQPTGPGHEPEPHEVAANLP